MLNVREQMLLQRVQRFYATNLPFLEVVKDITSGKNNTLSLRVLDWLVTSYSKRCNVIIVYNDEIVHLHNAYKNFLSSHSKRMFDAFRRRDRIHIDARGKIDHEIPDNVYLVSTVAQLVFFHWAKINGVIEYATEHIHEIEQDLRNFSESSLHVSHDARNALFVQTLARRRSTTGL